MSSNGQFVQHKKISTTEATIGTTASALNAHMFTLKPADFASGALPRVSAWKSAGLGAIVITIWERVGNNWNQLYSGGAAATLTATTPQYIFTSYGTYAVAKASATTGVEVTVTQVRK